MGLIRRRRALSGITFGPDSVEGRRVTTGTTEGHSSVRVLGNDRAFYLYIKLNRSLHHDTVAVSPSLAVSFSTGVSSFLTLTGGSFFFVEPFFSRSIAI